MSDLTVLVSPIPLYPSRPSSPFASLASRRNRSPSPIMVTLESDKPESQSAGPSHTHTTHTLDPGLLSPPINTWKSRPRSQTRNGMDRPRHRPTRSQSAPPTQTTFRISRSDIVPAPASVDDSGYLLHGHGRVPESQRRLPLRRSATSFGAAGYGYSYSVEGMTLRGGELVRPPPPLLRPTTFWRKAHRSGVAAATYSPSAHLVRRSTYIAAGLTFDAPGHDLSALCVEARINGEDGVRRAAPRVVEIPQAFEMLNI
ncbi:hypothetical protein R3P38DRAFT_3390900 [Favolaschia claudopus]|uniref:Uncharacterized protein n=1 Tax=Favolaschia claudopus TaxID=2862362 RepID=A0AAW0CLL4_9AGAR